MDRELLDDARKVRAGTTDAELIDEALAALLARYRAVEIDDAYDPAYRAHPIDEPDEWGDLASFHDAAAATRRFCRSGASCGGANHPGSADDPSWCCRAMPPSRG